MSTRMNYLRGEVDLTEWGITEDIGKTIMREISETITEQLKETPPWLDLPAAWGDGTDGRGNPAPADPLTIYLDVPLGEGDDDITWEISFEALVDDVIELHEAGGQGGKVKDEKGCAVCRTIAARLRALADKLEQATKEDV